MATPKLDTEIRQKQIVQAALDLVSRHGLSGLSIAGIAGMVGVVPSAIYRHFTGKDQVVDAILDLIRERLLDNVTAAARAGALDGLKLLLQRHVELIQANPGILRLVFSEEVMHGPPPRRAKVAALLGEYLDGVAELMRRGQSQGLVRPDVPAPTLAVAFLGLIQPAAILWHVSAGAFDVARHADLAWRVFVRGLAPAPPAAAAGHHSPTPGKEDCHEADESL